MNSLARTLACLLPLGVVSALGLAQTERPWSVAPDAFTHAGLAPEKALAYVEFADADGLLARGLEHPFLRTLLASAAGRELRRQVGGGQGDLLSALDERVGYALLPSLTAATAHGAAFSFHLRRFKPAWVLSLHGSDAAEVERALALALEAVAEKSGHPGAFAQPARREGDLEIWNIGELALARRGAWIVAAESEDGLRDALARERGLSAAPEFAASYAARAGDETLWGWAALGTVRAFQELSDGDKGLVEMAAGAAKPAVQFLLGPSLAVLGRAQTWSVGLGLHGTQLALSLEARGIAAGAAGPLLPPADGSTPLAPPGGARNQLSAVLYRDLAGVFRERNALFAPADQPGFAEAESNLALFFGGRDVPESVLPRLSPWICAVVRPVTFDERARPEAVLPAAALLVPIEAEGETGEDLIAGFQTMISLINVDRAQKGLDSMRMDLESESGVTLTTARFRAPNPEDGVDLRYNLEPACALVGERFVIGTHRALVAELVRELVAPDSQAERAQPGEWLRLEGAALAELVAANRELLVMNRVLDEGVPTERAQAEIEFLRDGLAHLRELRLDVLRSSDDSVRVALDLTLRDPGAKH